jgi:small-conductance mechanosensitive channel
VDLSIAYQDLLWLVLGLVVGLPVLIVLLGEVSERLAQRGNPLAQGLRQFRNVVVPLLAVLFIMRYILGVASSARWSQVVETVVYVALMVCGLTFIRNLVRLAEIRPASRLNNVPRIFFALARALVLLVISGHLLASVWGIELSRLTTALGVGSLVMALALQDTLSNLVSGFLLLADRPFKVGDWCEIGGKRMQVQEVGWRTTRFASFETRGLLMFPNGSLGKEIITNFGQEGSVYTMRQRIGFSYDDPPNRVKQVLLNLLLNMEE